MSVPPDFRGRRFALANAFRHLKTAREAARELGTETGSVFGLIQRMHSEGILEADTDPGAPTRGTQYQLTHPARIALDDIALQTRDEGQEVGRLLDDQRVLIVEEGTLAAVETVLADPGLSAEVAWGAWLGASWLLAMAPDADGHAWRRLATVLEKAGCRCERGKIDELQAAGRLREQSASNLERAGVLSE